MSQDEREDVKGRLPTHGATLNKYDNKLFYQLHTDASEKIQKLCSEWSHTLSLLGEEDTGQPSEDGKLLIIVIIFMLP